MALVASTDIAREVAVGLDKLRSQGAKPPRIFFKIVNLEPLSDEDIRTWNTGLHKTRETDPNMFTALGGENAIQFIKNNAKKAGISLKTGPKVKKEA